MYVVLDGETERRGNEKKGKKEKRKKDKYRLKKMGARMNNGKGSAAVISHWVGDEDLSG